MSQNNFCPTCRKIADEFLDENILHHNAEFLNRPSSTLSNPQDPPQCLGCERILSPLVQDDYEQASDQKDVSGIELISHSSESASLASLNDHPDLLGIEEVCTFSTDHMLFNNNFNCNPVDPMICDSNDQNIDVDTIAISGPSEESESSRIFAAETQSNDQYSNLLESDGSILAELSSAQPAITPEGCVMLVVPAINLYEDTNLMPTSEFNIDLDAIASELFRKTEKNELSQTNSIIFAAETESNAQPSQEETGSTCNMASDGEKESTIESSSTKELNLRDEGAENSIRCIEPKQRKDYKKMAFITYRLDTKQEVSIDEVEAVLNNNLTIDLSKRKSFTCKIRHKCPERFNNLARVTDHMFCEFFFVRCKICLKRFKYLRKFKQHHQTCKESISDSISILKTNSINCISSNVCDQGDTQLQLEPGTENDQLMPVDENMEPCQDDVLDKNSDVTPEKKVDNSTDEINSHTEVIEGEIKTVDNKRKRRNTTVLADSFDNCN